MIHAYARCSRCGHTEIDERVYRVGGAALDCSLGALVFDNGSSLDVTPQEIEALAALMRYPGRYVPSFALMQATNIRNPNGLPVMLCKLRRRLDGRLRIIGRWGKGYRVEGPLEPDDPGSPPEQDHRPQDHEPDDHVAPRPA